MHKVTFHISIFTLFLIIAAACFGQNKTVTITTVSLKKVSCGTEVTVVQEGVPAAIPPEACYLGWQESLTLLAKLVEAEIPD